ncbi:TetR/AcrR family transcriptional regulator [Pseudooceanicola marinus]|uniref:TetR/AcrR family transcriptional regulator n=1 Tax=Pseudooceanicola marinus TaxID=396013 RepID=UPI001C9726D1|nr:TetR/AcrR family transcriptional regulator [Pseudooceanicola marinus]MBY5972607.1 TetR/AcrR family transcriptional regulator [Ferrimonas balearica]MCA1335752.1 TetR/AcrR family transcriptional regulator [Pseudooceanicola marinus]
MTRQTSPGRRGRKYDQVLEGARRIFLKDGFDNANVDDIAREAGVSKATLYSYFPDKRLLFIEIARSECHRHADQAKHFVLPDLPAEEMLTAIARRTVQDLSHPIVVSMYRLATSESNRFPDLAQAFYEAGPQLTLTKLSTYLAEATERGELQVHDPGLAADQFLGLCKSTLMLKLQFGMIDALPAAEGERIADEAVKTFLCRYGAPTKETA